MILFLGWLNGPHPEVIGEIVDLQVCFKVNRDCDYHNLVQVINCGDFYLYYFFDTPLCNMRYCAI